MVSDTPRQLWEKFWWMYVVVQFVMNKDAPEALESVH
jgi:hypothetical protein